MNISAIKNAMKFKLGLDVLSTSRSDTVAWTHYKFKDIVFLCVKKDSGMEIHFLDLTLRNKWEEAGKDISKELPLSGTKTSKDILGMFAHIFQVFHTLGFKQVNTTCRCAKRRRIYMLASKRLGATAVEEAESIQFSL